MSKPGPTLNQETVDRILKMNGYATIRDRITSAVTAAHGIPVEAYDAAIAYAEQQAAHVQASTMEDRQDALDNIEADIKTIRACRHLAVTVSALIEARQRRAAIAKPNGVTLN